MGVAVSRLQRHGDNWVLGDRREIELQSLDAAPPQVPAQSKAAFFFDQDGQLVFPDEKLDIQRLPRDLFHNNGVLSLNGHGLLGQKFYGSISAQSQQPSTRIVSLTAAGEVRKEFYLLSDVLMRLLE